MLCKPCRWTKFVNELTSKSNFPGCSTGSLTVTQAALSTPPAPPRPCQSPPPPSSPSSPSRGSSWSSWPSWSHPSLHSSSWNHVNHFFSSKRSPHPPPHRQHMTLTKQFAEEYENIQEKRTPGPKNFSLMEYRRLPNGPPFQNYWENQVRATLWHDDGSHLFFMFLHSM